MAWESHAWPDSGRFGDQHWAALHRISVRSFHDLVTRLGIPHVPIGRVIWVDAEDMRAAFPKSVPTKKPTPKAKPQSHPKTPKRK